MKLHRNSSYHGSALAFIDMLFNIIILFVLISMAAFLMMNPLAKKKDIESKADLMIVMTWPDNDPNDIDLWLKSPNSIIGYPNRENSYLHLEQDNLGKANNFIMKDGNKIDLPVRREVISFRGTPNGRYVTNVHFFSGYQWNGNPVPIVIELIQINPVYKVLMRKELSLERPKVEKTAFAFIIQDNTIVDSDNDLEEPFLAEYSTYNNSHQMETSN